MIGSFLGRDLPPKDPKVGACNAVLAESLHFREITPSLQYHGIAVKGFLVA